MSQTSTIKLKGFKFSDIQNTVVVTVFIKPQPSMSKKHSAPSHRDIRSLQRQTIGATVHMLNRETEAERLLTSAK